MTSFDAQAVERIVREVMRRLAADTRGSMGQLVWTLGDRRLSSLWYCAFRVLPSPVVIGEDDAVAVRRFRHASECRLCRPGVPCVPTRHGRYGDRNIGARIHLQPVQFVGPDHSSQEGKSFQDMECREFLSSDSVGLPHR